MGLSIVLQGQEMVLYPGGGLYWPLTDTLIVADLHLGKGAAFRNRGQAPIPSGSTQATLRKLTGLVTLSGARKILVLGDLWHAREGCDEETLQSLGGFLSSHPDLEMVLIEGNHDRRSGCPEEELGVVRLETLNIGPFEFMHEPRRGKSGYAMAGHVHPAVRLLGGARVSHRFPCLWASEQCAILPAFGEFTGCQVINPGVGDGVWLVTESLVKELRPHAHYVS